MRITDHINLQGKNPLVGAHDDQLGARFPDMGRAYDRDAGQLLDQLAVEAGIQLKTGVYIGVLGPSYETPAEVRMYGLMGGARHRDEHSGRGHGGQSDRASCGRYLLHFQYCRRERRGRCPQPR